MASFIYVRVAVLAAMVTLSACYILTDRHGNEVEDSYLDSWPEACAGKYYCWEKNKAYINQQHKFDKLLSNQILKYRQGDEIDDREIEVNDIGNCKPTPNPPRKIYMIKDKNGTVWYVPQTVNFTISIQIEECRKLQGRKEYRITQYDNTSMQAEELERKNVQCVEQKVYFKFPVVHKNGIVLRSPYKGLPLSCSTKIVKTK